MRKFLTLFFVFMAIPLLAAAPSFAAITDWQDIGGGRARLVAMLDPETNLVRGAVEIELNEGWKTYWREPGSSGIPPQFNFAGSRHFMPGEVGLPAPSWLKVGEEVFAGYRGQTSFYFEGQPLEGSDGLIRLDFLAGVCEQICIPAQAVFEIPLESLKVTDPRARVRVTLAHSRLPDAPRPGFRILSARQESDGALMVEAELPQGTEPALFIETPKGLQHRAAEVVDSANGRIVFRAQPLKSGTVPEPGRYRFTLSAGGTAAEQWIEPGL
jgi:DsbC/DsbD-like thiol-disulfide interchange protein